MMYDVVITQSGTTVSTINISYASRSEVICLFNIFFGRDGFNIIVCKGEEFLFDSSLPDEYRGEDRLLADLFGKN